MIDVPREFIMVRQGPLTLVLRRDVRALLLDRGIGDPERLCADSGVSAHAGRGSVPAVDLASGTKERALVRKYRRGGLLRFLNGDLFLGATRSFDELAVTLEAGRAGIPVADMLGAARLRVFGPLYRHYLVSRELSDCLDLPALFSGGSAAFDAGTLAEAVAGCIRHMHDSGFCHGDLNLKNILVRRDDPCRVVIIDWDKSTRLPRALTPEERSPNVLRLCRSAVKFAARSVPVPEGFVDMFLDRYWEDPSRAAHSRLELQRALRRHRLFWGLQS